MEMLCENEVRNEETREVMREYIALDINITLGSILNHLIAYYSYKPQQSIVRLKYRRKQTGTREREQEKEESDNKI